MNFHEVNHLELQFLFLYNFLKRIIQRFESAAQLQSEIVVKMVG